MSTAFTVDRLIVIDNDRQAAVPRRTILVKRSALHPERPTLRGLDRQSAGRRR